MRYKKISLLPYEMQQRKQARKISLWMVSVQIGILLAFGATLLLLSLWERTLEERVYALAIRIDAFDNEPALAAMRLDETRRMLEFVEEYYQENFPVEFDVVWKTTIIEKLPENVWIDRISYRRQEIWVVGEARDLTDTETYRLELLKADFFETVRLGRVVLLDSGMFSYELHIGVYLDED